MSDELEGVQQTPDETKPVELSDAALESVAGGTKAEANKPVSDSPKENLSFNFTKIEFKY